VLRREIEDVMRSEPTNGAVLLAAGRHVGHVDVVDVRHARLDALGDRRRAAEVATKDTACQTYSVSLGI
jgi:hypothetical protein